MIQGCRRVRDSDLVSDPADHGSRHAGHAPHKSAGASAPSPVGAATRGVAVGVNGSDSSDHPARLPREHAAPELLK